MVGRDREEGLLEVLEKEGVGWIVFSPLAKGVLSDRYLKGIPADSRAARDFFLKKKDIGEATLAKVRALNEIAAPRGQTLAEMAVAWVLRHRPLTTPLLCTSKLSHLNPNTPPLQHLKF